MTEIDEKISVSDLKKSLQRFGWLDYVVFLMMLLSCALIGVYFGFIEKQRKRKNIRTNHNESEVAQDYLLGRRQMSVVPVALSLVASWISGISLLGLATEVYLYGTPYFFILITLVISGILMGYIYLPIFHKLQLTSLNEYLERRFDKRMRLFGSVVYTVAAILYLPVVIYVPALAFNQVTGVNIHVVTPFLCVVCIFYTLVGGIKAVIWTDSVQTVIMVGSMMVIIVKGTMNVSGFETVWARNFEGERLVFPEFSLGLTERHSVLSLLIGGIPFFVSSCILNQSMTQRYLSLPTIREANYALIIFIILLCTLMGICMYSGLLIYATFHGCDPLKTKLISSRDQLLPILVMSTLGGYPGLSGLFVAGIFSAALSSLSTSLNSMAAVVLEDFYKPYVTQPLSEKQTSYLMRGVVLAMGAISLALVFVVEHLGTVLQLSMSFGGALFGPMFGVYTMGLSCPWVHKRGAFVGGIVGILSMAWILIKAKSDEAMGALTFSKKPLNTDSCSYIFSAPDVVTNSSISFGDNESSFQLHHISYLYYTILGGLITIGVGSMVSLFCEEKIESDMDPMLFTPFARKFIDSRKLLSIRPNVKEQNCVTHAFETKDTQI